MNPVLLMMLFHRSLAAQAVWVLLSLASGCNARTDEAMPGSDAAGPTSRTVLRRAVPVSVSVTVESLATPDPGIAATGAAYETALAASVLPDEAPTVPISLAPSDSTDTTNYRAEGWWMGRSDSSPRGRWRFSLDFERFTSGVVVLRLDTLLTRDQQQPPLVHGTAIHSARCQTSTPH